MSYIRFGQERHWTEGDMLYAYPNVSGSITGYNEAGSWNVPTSDWIEVTMIILKRSEDFTAEEMSRIYDALIEGTYHEDGKE